MSELEELQASILDRLRKVVGMIEEIEPASLNLMPEVEGTNSPYVLGAHVLGNARAYLIGIASEREFVRNRPGEFASSGDSAKALRAQLEALEAEIAAVLPHLTDLDKRLMPRQELWGPNPVREITVRRALLQVIEHASLHLGHLEITRDLLSSGKAGT
jgi:hypothetical protein